MKEEISSGKISENLGEAASDIGAFVITNLNYGKSNILEINPASVKACFTSNKNLVVKKAIAPGVLR